ncbi:translation initiation factor eIF-2B subunit delta [Colias croceus]|uniref:translation initiation factor eIF-2B subunit delta n=1 Tax=Colias crocea TaxID=72248 RepID=UPI001E280E54|nr:translation initiation factor eIF-2B subunit delta [Colias croceus]
MIDELDKYYKSCASVKEATKMSAEAPKSRDDVKAAREAKKLAKQNAKKKGPANVKKEVPQAPVPAKDTKPQTSNENVVQENKEENQPQGDYYTSPYTNLKYRVKDMDEVDKAEMRIIEEKIKAINEKAKGTVETESGEKVPVGMTVDDVVNTLKEIVNVAKEVETVTAMVHAMDVKKTGEAEKSKAELRKERRMKQEAQRAAKQAIQKEAVKAEQKQQKEAIAKTKEIAVNKEKSPKPKAVEKPKVKSQSTQKLNWFQHLSAEHHKEALKHMTINSNLHPAVVKLGVQLATGVITGSNARCIALLDALKKMVRDYSLPARTEFARGLEAQLAASLGFLWSLRPPAAAQINALKHFRHQLTQLPNNVDEFDAKKTLQEEIDRYIREQIDMAGEAISITVRNKISNGDNILTYGCSSLIERILREAHEAGVQYRAVIVGHRLNRAATEMLRRLVAAGVACTYVDISALNCVMKSINKVVLGANSLLANGSVLGAAGTLQVALVARAHNAPVLVACETHKFSDRVQTDAFVYNEIGDPDALIDKSDDNSPLKDWRTNPNLTLLNLTYDVTPPSLVTAVVTELAILPCTSAPVVLRFKTSEYGM